MGKIVRLAWALVRIPHLTISLFLFPLVISIVLVVGQLVATELFLSAVDPTTSRASNASNRLEEATAKKQDSSPVRWFLYGSEDIRPPMRVCRWIPDPENPQLETPPNAECRPDRLDVALNVVTPETFSVEAYEKIFTGQIDRLHVCHSCAPDVVIGIDKDGKKSTRTLSVYGLAVLSLAFVMKKDLRAEHTDHFGNLMDNLGLISFLVPDSTQAIVLSKTNAAIPITANVVPLVVIALWLSVRAHRKVLDYFARNEVLLPLVAATGKSAFYGAIWFLTALRVLSFLAASVPIVCLGLKDIAGETVFRDVLEDVSTILLWLLALVSAVALSTIVSSIADLKHRHALLNVLYRYLPILIALLGSFVWSATFLIPSDGASLTRLWISAIPVLGLVPVFLAPITHPLPLTLGIHAFLSVALIVWILRSNTRWFAAHLEEV